MNKTEIALLELTGKAVDARCMTRFQKLCRDVSWRGFLVGTLLAAVLASIAEILFRVQQTSFNTNAIFIIGIFIATTRLGKFSAFVLTIESLISYYILFYQGRWASTGLWPFTVGFLVFSLLAFGVYMYVRKTLSRTSIHQSTAQSAFKASILDGMRVPVPPC